MHFSLCQDLKINLPQALVTVLVMCWHIHYIFFFSVPLPCVFLLPSLSKMMLQKSVLLSPMVHQTISLKVPALMHLYNLKLFLLSLILPITFYSRKKATLFTVNLFYMMWQVSWSLQLSCEADGKFCDSFS